MAIRLARSLALPVEVDDVVGADVVGCPEAAKLWLCPAAIASGPTSDGPLGRVRGPLAVNTASIVARSRRLSPIALK
jgi:hypothetical protein